MAIVKVELFVDVKNLRVVGWRLNHPKNAKYVQYSILSTLETTPYIPLDSKVAIRWNFTVLKEKRR